MNEGSIPLLEMPVVQVLLVVLGVGLLGWFAWRRARRLRQLEAATRSLRERPLPLPADDADDGVGRLTRAVYQLAGDLHQRIEALERDRGEREKIIAHMTDGVALIDGTGHILRANHSMAALLLAPLPPAPGTPFHEFIRAPELHALVQDARARGHAVETELRLWTPHPRLVRATATPLGRDERDAVLIVLHDLTEEERVNRMRQDFVANVSHELRTPLTSLRGYAETLLDGGLEDVQHREEFVRVIRDQAVRLNALIDDLLSLSDLERAGASLRVEWFDLRELVERDVAMLRPRAERAGLALRIIPGGPVRVSADPARIEQVVANLLDNAIKYTERGVVTVSLGNEDGLAWCEVADTGPGVPREDLPRIFERFYRVDKARSREKSGTGLGLSIVKHIVALHGGTVAVDSRHGRGSTFRFELPVGVGSGAPATD